MTVLKQFKRPGEFLPQELNRLTVRVPGSSANLGPGFDALALAYQLYCRLQFHILDEDDSTIPFATLNGCLIDDLPKDENNLLYTVLKKLWQNEPNLLRRVRINIESEIPLGKGLGSSAAAITGTVWAAYALRQQTPDKKSVLAQAAAIEGHADNAAASLLGGLVVSSCSANLRAVVTQKVLWPTEWACIVCVPSMALSTRESRSALPRQISRDDAVYNLQRVALLLAAVQNRDEEAMQEALHDRLHEPYRLKLVPQLAAIRKVVSDLSVIGCVLSGAGSSVLTIVHQRHRQQLCQALTEWSCKHDARGEVLELLVDQEGLQVSYE